MERRTCSPPTYFSCTHLSRAEEETRNTHYWPPTNALYTIAMSRRSDEPAITSPNHHSQKPHIQYRVFCHFIISQTCKAQIHAAFFRKANPRLSDYTSTVAILHLQQDQHIFSPALVPSLFPFITKPTTTATHTTAPRSPITSDTTPHHQIPSPARRSLKASRKTSHTAPYRPASPAPSPPPAPPLPAPPTP